MTNSKDDPLSAVDSRVGHRLFHCCIRELLRPRLVVLVTHQLQVRVYLSFFLFFIARYTMHDKSIRQYNIEYNNVLTLTQAIHSMMIM